MRAVLRTVCLISVLLGATGAAAKPPSEAPPRIAARDLQADFAVLKQAYEELHPGLYRYTDKAKMDAHFAALRAELERDLTLQEAYLAFSVFLAKVQCGHTYANFYNQPKAVASALFEQQNRVPFYFRWLDRRMIVTRNFSKDARLVPGTEVLAINGTPVAKILERLLTVARADGSNDAKRVNYLEVAGRSHYEAFDIYFPLFFPSPGRGLKVQLKPPAGKVLTLNLEALTYEQRRAPI